MLWSQAGFSNFLLVKKPDRSFLNLSQPLGGGKL